MLNVKPAPKSMQREYEKLLFYVKDMHSFCLHHLTNSSRIIGTEL